MLNLVKNVQISLRYHLKQIILSSTKCVLFIGCTPHGNELLNMNLRKMGKKMVA